MSNRPSEQSSNSSQPAQTPMQVTKYHYDPLRDGEVRLIHLLPGAFADDICLRLVHRSLVAPDDASRPNRVSKRDLQSTLEGKWHAFKTPEGGWAYVTPDHERMTHEYPFRDQHPELASRLEKKTEPNGSNPTYTALSYVWGDDSKPQQVYIMKDPSGSEVAGLIKIGQNLDAALRYLRHDSEEHVLWVDAICINQSDREERSTQVARMNQVYGLAHRVTVWLGPRSEDSGIAVEALNNLGRQVITSLTGRLYPAPGADSPMWADTGTELPYNALQWDALIRFFSRPWFERLWVMQEIALANERAIVQCGHDSITISRLRRAMVALSRKTLAPAKLVRIMHQNYGLKFGFATMPMVWLFEGFCLKKCEDARDRLYGILGLLGPKVRHTIQPSYDQPPEAIYEEVFLGYSRNASRLDLLTECLLDGHSPTSPSWVPDWRLYPKHINLGYKAAGVSKASFQLLDGGVLEVVGRCCGTVSRMNDPYDGADASVAQKLHELKPNDTDLYPTGELIEEAWLRTLCLDTLRERYPRGRYSNLAQWRDLISRVSRRHSSVSKTDGDGGSSAEDNLSIKAQPLTDIQRFRASSFDVLHRSRFFHTTSGHFGFGPLDLQPADKVFVILGVCTPLILRPTPTSPGTFQVVRWCYVHGIMDGEALLGPLPADWRRQQNFDGYRFRSEFFNQVTGEESSDDPRLEPLGIESGWKRMDWEMLEFTADDPIDVDFFENTTTKETVNYDPRITIEMIEKRGVKLETVRLV